MTIASGIHAGGTYTEAVLANHDSGMVPTGVQALTTRHDLSVGIGQAVSMGSGHSLPVACGHELTTRLNAGRRRWPSMSD
jgi:N-methylhydantoinase A/oxoprolinase/acetone carboxylase beta subunit